MINGKIAAKNQYSRELEFILLEPRLSSQDNKSVELKLDSSKYCVNKIFDYKNWMVLIICDLKVVKTKCPTFVDL